MENEDPANENGNPVNESEDLGKESGNRGNVVGEPGIKDGRRLNRRDAPQGSACERAQRKTTGGVAAGCFQ